MESKLVALVRGRVDYGCVDVGVSRAGWEIGMTGRRIKIYVFVAEM